MFSKKDIKKIKQEKYDKAIKYFNKNKEKLKKCMRNCIDDKIEDALDYPARSNVFISIANMRSHVIWGRYGFNDDYNISKFFYNLLDEVVEEYKNVDVKIENIDGDKWKDIGVKIDLAEM